MFNIEVFDTCQMSFWLSSFFSFPFFWALHRGMLCKVSPFTVKSSPKGACHKIQWLQFANRNIVGFQSWHSSIHFQIPITPAISTLQLRLGIDYNFGLVSTTICEHGFPKHNWVKSDRKSPLKLETMNALMQVSLCDLPIGIYGLG